MTVLVSKTLPSVWTLMSMNRQQMANEFPELRRFFDCGYQLDPKRHGDGIVGLVGPLNSLRINLENGEFE